MNMLNLPKKVYFKKGCMGVALKELDEVYGLKRAFIVSDANLYRSGVVAPVIDFLRKRGVKSAEFFTLSEVPSFADVKSGLPKMHEFEPDVILAVGGGSVISAAKAMWLLYENDDLDLAETAKNFGALTGTDVGFPATNTKAKLVALATTFGTGAQNSPFAVLADDDGKECVIASYKLLPEMSITDSLFVETLPAELIKKNGLALISQAIRAYAAPGANAYTQGLLAEVTDIVLKNLEAGINGCHAAIETLCNAGAIAGFAVGNAVETIDPAAEVFPTTFEKGQEISAYDDLANDIGLEDLEALMAAVEKLAAL